MYSELSKEQSLRKVAGSLHIFRTTLDEVERYVEMLPSSSSGNCLYHYNIEIFNLFDPELQPIYTKPIIKNKLKELLSELKKFKVQSVLVLKYEKK